MHVNSPNEGNEGEREKRSLRRRAAEAFRSHTQHTVKVVALDVDAAVLHISVAMEEGRICVFSMLFPKWKRERGHQLF